MNTKRKKAITRKEFAALHQRIWGMVVKSAGPRQTAAAKRAKKPGYCSRCGTKLMTPRMMPNHLRHILGTYSSAPCPRCLATERIKDVTTY